MPCLLDLVQGVRGTCQGVLVGIIYKVLPSLAQGTIACAIRTNMHIYMTAWIPYVTTWNDV